MAGPRVHAIIVNWRTAGLTLAAAAACLRAMEGVEGALTLVDNASGDDSCAVLSAAVVLLVVAFLFLTAPVSAHMIGRAAKAAGVPTWEGTTLDESPP